MPTIDEAVEAIEDGDLVVYPTETVYGLGGNALESGVVERVFTAKDRPRSNPMALAVAAIDEATAYVDPDAQTLAFMEAFLPGPVTVIAPKRPSVPGALTGGRDRVGVRIPDCPAALELLERTPPLTATSANVSGRPPVTTVDELDGSIKRVARHIIDGGETPGGASTVVDVTAGRIHRRGLATDAVATWLTDHGIDLA